MFFSSYNYSNYHQVTQYIMRILHVLFTAELGGLEQAFIDITDGLSHKGHHMISLVRDDAPYIAPLHDRTTVVHANPSGFYDVRAVLRIRALLKKHAPDIIIAHAPKAIQVCHYARIGLGIPLCGVMHSYRFKRAVKADYLIALTSHMKQAIAARGYPAQRCFVIPNSIIVPECPPEPPAIHSPLRLGILARLVPEKAVGDIFEIAAQLIAQDIAVEVHIGGEGPEKVALQDKARHLNITTYWHGWVSDKRDFFDGIDIFCLTSHYEPYGIVLAEAFIHGTPVVSYNAEGPSNIITSGKNGMLCEVGDVTAFAAACKRIFESAECAQSFAEQGWNYAQYISRPRVAQLWDDCLASLTSVRKSG